MNINMLRDADDDAGFYAAACAADPLATWPGAGVYVSADAGVSYTLLVSLSAEATMGIARNALGDFFGGNIPDELNSVNVQLYNGSLSSTTYTGLLAGTNTAILGDEILFFRDATLEADGSYTLTGLLRGRRGSEYAMSQHAAEERFILVSTAMVRVPQGSADIGATRLYKPVTAGRTLAATAEQSFTNSGMGLKPYAPVHLGGGRNAAGDLTINWTRRNRIDGSWRDSVDVPNSEASEAYEVEILGALGGGTLIGADTQVYTSPAGSISIADHGAVDDGATDNRVAIVAAIAAAAATSEKTVWVPAGDYAWGGGSVIHLSGVKLTGAGQTSILRALDYTHSSIFMEGSGAQITNLKFLGATAPSRQAAWESNKITLYEASDFLISNIFIDGSPAAAIQTKEAANGAISHCTIRNSLSDSIHITDSSHDLLVEYNLIENSGDDGVAVVSYLSNAVRSYNITARYNHVHDNVSGRGMSVVGGDNVLYQNNLIENNEDWAGLYFAQENSYSTYSALHVKAEYNTIRNCGSAITGHAAIMIFSDGDSTNDDIWCLRNDIVQTGTEDGIRYFGPQTNILLEQNRITSAASNYVGGSDPDVTIIPFSAGAVGQSLSSVGRTFSVTAPTVTYLASEQTTDFGYPQETVNFRVYQLSAVVGRGHAASGSA